ncbi:MAG: hypothetical protein HZA50_18730 [Planctomycetes bacterium]|nr:hypothetical protein [Planctomycetota bacterium]
MIIDLKRLLKEGSPPENMENNLVFLLNSNIVFNAIQLKAEADNGLSATKLPQTNPIPVLFQWTNFQKDMDALRVHCGRFAGSKSRQIVAPGEAKAGSVRPERNPGKTGPFKKVSDFQPRHWQTWQNFSSGLINGFRRNIYPLWKEKTPGWSLFFPKSHQYIAQNGRPGRSLISLYLPWREHESRTCQMTQFPGFRFVRLAADSLHPGLLSAGLSGLNRCVVKLTAFRIIFLYVSSRKRGGDSFDN